MSFNDELKSLVEKYYDRRSDTVGMQVTFPFNGRICNIVDLCAKCQVVVLDNAWVSEVGNGKITFQFESWTINAKGE